MDCTHPLKPLYQTDHGIVFLCRGCGYFHVVFGPVILAHDTRGFTELKQRVETLEPERDPSTHVGERCYHLHTKSRQVGLAFTPAEVEELRDLLGGAAAMLDLETLLRDELGPDALDDA